LSKQRDERTDKGDEVSGICGRISWFYNNTAIYAPKTVYY